MKKVFLFLLLCSCATQSRYTRVDENKTPVSDSIIANKEVISLKSNICKNLSEKECSVEFGEMLRARLQLNYPLADEATVLHFCKAYPQYCSEPEFLERAFAKSHNSAIKD